MKLGWFLWWMEGGVSGSFRDIHSEGDGFREV